MSEMQDVGAGVELAADGGRGRVVSRAPRQPHAAPVRGLVGRGLLFGAVLSMIVASAAVGAGTDGSLIYKGKTVPLEFGYLIKSPDSMSGEMIRRLVLSQNDMKTIIEGCKDVSCVEGELTEGLIVDFPEGTRLNYWVAINGGRIQYSGTAMPGVVLRKVDEAKHLIGIMTLDDAGAGGPEIDVKFDAEMLKEFSK